MSLRKNYKGLVIKKFNDFYLVEINHIDNLNFNKKLLCKLRKSVNFKNQFIYVGDYVLVDQVDLTYKKATIVGLLKRDNLLLRPSVANISNIYVIFSVDEPKLNLSQVNRFLISAELMGVDISLVLTKCDLISEEKRIELIDQFQKWGYPIITLSSKNRDDLKNFLIELKTKKCSIFMGPSGVGKTTLLNKIIPGLESKTAPVSKKIKRGKNTTRNVELFSLSAKSFIVDSPGFNMQKIVIDQLELQNLFPEIHDQIATKNIKCKFRNCLHINDIGCNLNKNFERYPFYKEIIEDSKNHRCLIQED